MDETFSDFLGFFFLGRTASPISSLEYSFPARMGEGGLGEGIDSVEGNPSTFSSSSDEGGALLPQEGRLLVNWSALRSPFGMEL
jgi:hypothetical protein